MLTLGSLHPPPVMESVPTPKPKNVKKSPAPSGVAMKEGASESKNDLTPKFPLPSAYLPYSAQPEKKKDRKTVYWVLFAFAGVAFALWARNAREKTTVSESAVIAEMSTAAEPKAVAAGNAEGVEESVASDASETHVEPNKTKPEDALPEELPLREGERLKKGHGLLEIVAGKSDTIYIDGKPVGSGPVVSLPMKARTEAYEVRIKTRGEERSRFVTVKDQKLVRLRLAPPWQR